MIASWLAWTADPNAWAALVTLTAMEIVLGIDNVVFISVLVARLPAEQARLARITGLTLAFVFRIALLFMLSWIIGLKEPVITLLGKAFSWRDIILMVGGLFLLYKATVELHHEAEHDDEGPTAKVINGLGVAIAQIAVIDLVFSIDSIITAIGMAQQIEIMVLAVILSMLVMFAASGGVSEFIARHPTTKVLALSFLVLIGTSLFAEGWGFHLPRGYIYSAMAFSALVEMLNIRIKTKRRRLREAQRAAAPPA
ncbi:MAG: TerC family protein [Methylobacteriaceae bacterium]|nr:TerC family protein [Methylobacteriaceae bacterium]